MNQTVTAFQKMWTDNKKTIVNGGLGLLIIGIVVLLINTQLSTKREKIYIQKMREFTEQAEQATKYSDSLQSQIRVRMEEAKIANSKALIAETQARRSKNTTNILLQELDMLKESLTDSIEMARVIIPKQDSVIEQQQVTIAKQDTQILFLNMELTAKDTALFLSNQRGDSLYKVINNIPTPPKPSRLPIISRKKALFIGIASGILLTKLIL